MDFATYQSAEAKYHITGGEVYRVSPSPQPALPSAAPAPPPAARTPLYSSPLPSACLNVMTPSSMGEHRLAGEHQLEVNQGIRNTLNALRSTLGSQGAAIRGADHAVKSQQSDLTQLCVGLADLQAATAATSTELAGMQGCWRVVVGLQACSREACLTPWRVPCARLQPLAHMVAASGTYGCSLWHIWLQDCATRRLRRTRRPWRRRVRTVAWPNPHPSPKP